MSLATRGVEFGADQMGRLAGWNQVLFERALEQAQAHGRGGEYEEVLKWCSLAAWFASDKGWFGEVSCRPLEEELLRAAQQIPRPVTNGGRRERPCCLHVMTEAYGTLGHTNLCRRWMQFDDRMTHSVALVNQQSRLPENLVETVRRAGGECIVLRPSSPMLERAGELRRYAWQHADLVVLHTHPDDVVPTVAFGVEGGPPVALMNHADHVFWGGCSVADLVLDIRPSGHDWTKSKRGVSRAMILPLPLTDVPAESIGDSGRDELRRQLGIPKEAVMLLSVGSRLKYEPVAGLDFIKTAREIIQQVENAWLVAVGPRDEAAWRTARTDTQGRIRAVGYQPDSALFCQAADLYVEGFPLGSLTALLEAGLSGLPCVRGPGECIPPYTSDDVSLEFLRQPKCLSDYVSQAVRLARNAGERAAAGAGVRRAILKEHCGADWLARLEAAKSLLPAKHAVYRDFRPAAVAHDQRDWFLRYLYRRAVPSVEALAAEFLVGAWKRTAAEPQLDSELLTKLHCAGYRNTGLEWKAKSGPREKLRLWSANGRIRRRGRFEKLMVASASALGEGRRGQARREVWKCLLSRPGCIGDRDWLKLWLKAHGGMEVAAQLKQWRALFQRRSLKAA